MKKILALLLAVVMVLGMVACASKTETPAETTTTEPAAETTTEETKTEDPAPAEETTGEKMYIPVMAKGFQHQFWQAVAAGSAAEAVEVILVQLHAGRAVGVEGAADHVPLPNRQSVPLCRHARGDGGLHGFK